MDTCRHLYMEKYQGLFKDNQSSGSSEINVITLVISGKLIILIKVDL